MVTQPTFYFRFDKKTWVNPDNSKLEDYVDYVDRYDVTTKVISYKIIDDIDFRSDVATVIISKTFFTNPKNNVAYDNSVDPYNSFSPNNTHVIAIGPLASVETADVYNTSMFIGVLQNVKDLGQNKVELEFWSPIKTMSDTQCGNSYKIDKFNMMSDDATPTVVGMHANGMDLPNTPNTYYEDYSFKEVKEGVSTVTPFYSKETSDAGFANGDANGDKIPYAVYSFSGIATADGSVKIRYYICQETAPREATVSFNIGHDASFISESFYDQLSSTINQSDGYIKVFDISGTRVTFVERSIIFESPIDFTTPMKMVEAPFECTENSGITTDYSYFGVNNGVLSGGRVYISPLYEKREYPATTLPLLPLSVYGFNTNSDGIKRHQYNGYPLTKIAWRLLHQVGWCRKPFFDAMNPFIGEYDGTELVKNTAYITDGLEMDFIDDYIYNGETYQTIPFFSSFDLAKQPCAFNLKTISDGMGLYMNAATRPKIEGYKPVWDEGVYNSKNSSLITFYGCSSNQFNNLVNINIKLPDGAVNVTTTHIHDMSLNAVASVVYDTIISTSGVTDYYDVEKHGNQIYIEFESDVGGITISSITSDPSSITPSLSYTQLNKSGYAYEGDRLKEKIYYLRKWGVMAGFHPYIKMQASPISRLQEPAVSGDVYYGGGNYREADITNHPMVGKPVWATDTKDMINKVIVKFTSGVSGDESGMVVLPSEVKEYKYYVIRLGGYVKAEAETATLTLNLGNVIGSASITVNLFKNVTSSDICAMFDNKILQVTGDYTYGFLITASGNYIFIRPFKPDSTYAEPSVTEKLIIDSTQIDMIFTLASNVSVENKEVVEEDDTLFNLARNSQAQYGIRQLSISLPETTSINDTMSYVSKLLHKYLNPKDRCICEMTNNNLPLFHYSRVVDYTNFDIQERVFDWYMDVIVYGTAQVTQTVTGLMFTKNNASIAIPWNTTDVFTSVVGERHNLFADKLAGFINGYIDYADNEPYYTTEVEYSTNSSTVHIFVAKDGPGRLNDFKLFFSAEPVRYVVKSYIDGKLNSSKIKERNLVLMRMEMDSKSGTYLAIFGQPSEDMANIINQVNTWVGDVEKGSSSTSSTTGTSGSSDTTYELIVKQSLLVSMGEGVGVQLDGASGDISNTGDIITYGNTHTYGNTNVKGITNSNGNVVCRFSGTPYDESRSEVFEILAPHTYDLTREKITMNSVGSNVFCIGSEVNIPIYVLTSSEWVTFTEIEADYQSVDSSIAGNYLFVAHTKRVTTDNNGDISLKAINIETGTTTNIADIIIPAGSSGRKSRCVATLIGAVYTVNLVYETYDTTGITNIIRKSYTMSVSTTPVAGLLVLNSTSPADIYAMSVVTDLNYTISFDIEEYYTLLIVVVAYSVGGAYRVQAFWKPCNDESEFTSDNIYDTLSDSNIDKYSYIGLTKGNDRLYVWGIKELQGTISLSACKVYLNGNVWNPSSLIFNKGNIGSIYTLLNESYVFSSDCRAVSYANYNGVSYFMVINNYSNNLSIYRIDEPDPESITVSDISNILSKDILNYGKLPMIVATGNKSCMGVYTVGAMSTASVPTAPFSLNCPNGYGSMKLTWSAPMWDGGSPILKYNVYRCGVGETIMTLLASPTALTYTDSSLPYASYHYKVSAVNIVGEGALSSDHFQSNLAVGIYPGPEIPALTGTAYEGYNRLNWSSPYDGGSSITSYEIYRSPDNINYKIIASPSPLPREMTYVDNDVALGAGTYYYKIGAVTANGRGVLSSSLSLTYIEKTYVAPATSYKIISTMEGAEAIIDTSSVVILTNNDVLRDYGLPPSDGGIIIPYDGYYSISWQMKLKYLTTGTVCLRHSPLGLGINMYNPLSGDSGLGYLSGNHSAIKLKKYDKIYLMVDNGDKDYWNNLEEAYIEVYLQSGG